MSDSSTGVGITGLLGIIFIGLKLGHVIDWSWWWVLSPFLLDAGLLVIAVVVLTLVAIFE